MDVLDSFFASVREQIDVDAIRLQWEALTPAYNVEQWKLPLPIWALRPLEHDGARAWQEIQWLSHHASTEKNLCIYMHIPFCTSKCGFCDSYSFKLGKPPHAKQYVELLCYELQEWSNQASLACRPVSTVHLGGGTPTFLSEELLTKLVACCRSCFSTTEQTEWALESTVESLTPSMSSCLHELGFRRLHIGVQTLQPEVRAIIGRRRSPSEVLATIEKHLSLGWIVSVDLICGLPGQTLDGWLNDIKMLISVGTDGFSLYELLIYPQNRRWASKYGLLERTHLPNYFLFQAGAWLLESYGYKKNLFNHWANQRDANIYFTYPRRGEDLIAIGTIANGTLSDYHYRHHRYGDYIQEICKPSHGLMGGIYESAKEKRARPIITSILAGYIPHNIAQNIQAMHGDLSLLDKWLIHCIIQPVHDSGFYLTTNGSWFAGNLIQEVTQVS